MLYKILDNSLVSTSETKMILDNGVYISVPKSQEELSGWKPLSISVNKTPNIYENQVIILSETVDNII